MIAPSIKRIIATDFFTFVSFVAPLAVLVLALDDKYIGVLSGFFSRGRSGSGESHEFFFIFSATLSSTLIPYAVYRIYLFRKWFKNSTVVRGIVTFVPAVSDRGTFRYYFMFNGRKYSSWNLVHRTKNTRAILPGQEVDIVVYNKNPKKAFIRDLYVKV
jgi:hypothetical protein